MRALCTLRCHRRGPKSLCSASGSRPKLRGVSKGSGSCFEFRIYSKWVNHLRERINQSPIPKALFNYAKFIEQDPDIARSIASILQRQHEDANAQRGRDVSGAIVEVPWALVHQKTEVAVGRIASLTNALLRSRGGALRIQRRGGSMET